MTAQSVHLSRDPVREKAEPVPFRPAADWGMRPGVSFAARPALCDCLELPLYGFSYQWSGPLTPILRRVRCDNRGSHPAPGMGPHSR